MFCNLPQMFCSVRKGRPSISIYDSVFEIYHTKTGYYFSTFRHFSNSDQLLLLRTECSLPPTWYWFKSFSHWISSRVYWKEKKQNWLRECILNKHLILLRVTLLSYWRKKVTPKSKKSSMKLWRRIYRVFHNEHPKSFCSLNWPEGFLWPRTCGKILIWLGHFDIWLLK